MNILGFLAFCFLGMTLLNRFIEGAYLSSADASIFNNILIFRSVKFLGLWDMPVLNTDFFTIGIPKIMTLDYSFFQGDAAMLGYFFYVISAMLALFLFLGVLGAISSLLYRR